jgi:voltage-gated potassium channel
VDSRPHLQRWEKRTEWPLAAVAVVFLAVYTVQVLERPHGSQAHVLWLIAWAAWGLFVVDYFARLFLAPDRFRWFLQHWFDLAIVALPFLRPLRLLRLVVLLGALHKAAGNAIRGRVVTYTVSAVILLIYVASIASWIVQRVSETETATQAATAAQIEELRDEIRVLAQQLRMR